MKVILAAIGTFFFISPLTTGIVPQSHIGKSKPARAAITHDKNIFLGKNLINVSFGIQICIIADTKLPTKINGIP
jgi:hypothetical protein